MSNIELVIDNREHALIKQLTNKTEYVVEQLQLGDVIFRNDPFRLRGRPDHGSGRFAYHSNLKQNTEIAVIL